MRIGFFSECWDPQINGVVTSTKALCGALPPDADRVYIFSPRYPGFRDTYPGMFRQFAVNYPFQPEFYVSSPLPHAAIRRAREWKLDLVHMHTEFTLGRVAVRVAHELQIPSVMTLHTLWEHYSHYFMWGIVPRNLFRFALAFFYRGIDYFIAPSGKAKDYLIDVMKIKKPIEIIPTGINLEAFCRKSLSDEERRLMRQQWGVGPKDTLLMFAGRIGREKAIHVLLQGLRRLRTRYPGLKLLLVGDGPHLSRLKRDARALGIERNVIFTGYIRYPDMPKMYQAADVFTIASVSETQGLVTVEALASGLPVIVKDDPASLEIIGGGEHGLVFHDDAEFPAVLERLLLDPALAKRLADGARGSVARYNADAYGKKAREFYQFILEDFKKRRKGKVRV